MSTARVGISEAERAEFMAIIARQREIAHEHDEIGKAPKPDYQKGIALWREFTDLDKQYVRRYQELFGVEHANDAART